MRSARTGKCAASTAGNGRGVGAAAASRRFDENRITDFLRRLERGFLVGDQSLGAGHDGDFGFDRRIASGDFVAESLHRLVTRSDERYVAVLANFGEVRVLREEPVTRMNGLRAAHFGRTDDPLDLQITFAARRRADAIRLVRHRQIMCPSISFAEHSDGFDPHFLAGANHTKSNFASIGDQDSLEHDFFQRKGEKRPKT